MATITAGGTVHSVDAYVHRCELKGLGGRFIELKRDPSLDEWHASFNAIVDEIKSFNRANGRAPRIHIFDPMMARVIAEYAGYTTDQIYDAAPSDEFPQFLYRVERRHDGGPDILVPLDEDDGAIFYEEWSPKAVA